MAGLIVLGVIILIIAGIMLIPIGADVRYEGGEFSASAKVCGMLLQLFPKPEGEGKEKKPKKPKRIKKEKPKEPVTEEAEPKKRTLKLNFNKDEILSLVRRVLKSFGKFGRKFKVDRFILRYVAAGDDPYNTAMTFAYVNAAISSLAPLCAKRFQVRDCHVSTDVDFTADSMSLDFGLAVSIRIGQIVNTLLAIIFGALGILIKNKLRLAREKRQAGKDGTNTPAEAVSEAEQQQEKEERENIQAEERMDSNG